MRSSRAFDTRTGAAFAILPTSSSCCMIFLIRPVGNRVSRAFGGILCATLGLGQSRTLPSKQPNQNTISGSGCLLRAPLTPS